MEEVDKIIIPILKQIGCPLADTIESVQQFESEQVYAAAAAIIRTINRESGYPKELPNAQAARFKLASSLTNDVKELGFTGELGYQTFLYPTEADTRKLLIWLVDKLPKTEGKEEEDGEEMGGNETIQEMISSSLKQWAEQIWSPLHPGVAEAPAVLKTVPLDLPYNAAAERAEYVQKLQPLVSKQPPQANTFPPSLFEANALDIVLAAEKEKELEESKGDLDQRRANISNLISGAFRLTVQRNKAESGETGSSYSTFGATGLSAFNRRKMFEQESASISAQVVTDSGAIQNVSATGDVQVPVSEDSIREEREKELAKLQEALKDLQDKLTKMDKTMDDNKETIRTSENELIALVKQCKTLEEAYKLKKRTFDLLPNAEKNLEQLGLLSAESSKRLLELNKEWEKVRVPLVQKVRKARQSLDQRKADVQRKVELIKRMRAEIKEKVDAVREKDAIYKQVAEELARLPKSINRQIYIRRIMDIVKNLDKQKDDIKKILVDVRRVQKDINQISKTSTRSFAVADEVVYQTAKSNRDDPVATQAYKNVVTMRDGFAALIEKVEETGRCKNEISDMRSRIESLESRNTSLNMERVLKDLEQVKKENQGLANKLRALRGGGKSGGDKEKPTKGSKSKEDDD